MQYTFVRLLAVAGAMAAATAVAGETVTYTGTATTTVSRMSLPLTGGESVMSAASAGVAAVSTTPPSLFEINCLGFGLAGTDGAYVADFYCTFKANDDDILDLKGVDDADGGKVTVIGGSGKWRGATGSGTFKRVSASETGASSTFEIAVTTP